MSDFPVSRFASRLASALLLLTSIPTGSVFAQEACESEGVEFGFFNGVKTTDIQAKRVVQEHLPRLYGLTTPKGQPITYTLYYNDTEGFSDFVETFEQRLKEQDGLLAGRFELFFSATQGGGTWWSNITEAVPALSGLLGGLIDTFQAYLIQGVTADFGSANTLEVARRHRDQIDHAVGMGRKMLLFAHSQGNLFVNAAYNHAVARSDFDSVRVVHVAPASPSLSGGHTLADLDLVINGLRTAGIVAPITDRIPGWLLRPPGLNGETDALGHGLLEIYLNPALSTSGRIRSHVEAALQALDSAPKKPLPPYPDFVETPWTGGEEPAYTSTQGDGSHYLEKLVARHSVPVLWKYSIDGVRGTWGRVWYDGYVDRSTTLEQVGRGFGGTARCTWARVPSEPGSITRTTTCTFQRFEESLWQTHLPSELLVYGYPSAETTVSLAMETYPVNSIIATGDGRGVRLRFSSGRFVVEEGQYPSGITYQYETTATVPGANNEAEIRAWRAKRNAFLAAEERRYRQYLEARSEYERRRQACEAASIPAPVPAPGIIRSPFLSLDECAPPNAGGTDCLV